MTVFELINIAEFLIIFAGLVYGYGKLSEKVNSLTKRQDNHDTSQTTRDRDLRTWQNGEPGRFQDARHQMLDRCQQEFTEIRDSLSYLKGQVKLLVEREKK
jgi:hypothetical protein